jgi:CRP-like cAMP-binding protein
MTDEAKVGRSITGDIMDAAIAASEFLSDLEEDSRAALLDRATDADIAEGVALITEGEPGDAFYIVRSGKVRVTIAKQGAPAEIADLGPGAVLGEISMLTDRKRTATCTVVDGPARVIRVSRTALEEVLVDQPELMSRLHKIAFERARETMRRLYS